MQRPDPKIFWQRQLDCCEAELIKETTPHGRKALQDEIDHAKQQLAAIANGTYKTPKVCHEVWTIR